MVRRSLTPVAWSRRVKTGATVRLAPNGQALGAPCGRTPNHANRRVSAADAVTILRARHGAPTRFVDRQGTSPGSQSEADASGFVPSCFPSVIGKAKRAIPPETGLSAQPSYRTGTDRTGSRTSGAPKMLTHFGSPPRRLRRSLRDP